MKKVLFCCTGMDEILLGSSKVEGIQVQMSFWAITFERNGWECYSFTSQEKEETIKRIHFIRLKNSLFLNKLKLATFSDWLFLSNTIHTIKPDVVIIRGASGTLRALSMFCRKDKTKLIMFGASDSDFVPGKEIITHEVYKKLYRAGVRNTQYFVVQNSFQQKTLVENYHKNSLLLPNIWINQSKDEINKLEYDAIWVSHLRKLKRAEWFVELAKSNPICHFAIVGGANERDYYCEIEKACSLASNIDFLGAQPFESVNTLMSKSKMLVCTSEFEGFPNTFLQAWAQGLPVISTVDPNGIFQNYHVGSVIKSVDDLKEAFDQLMNNVELFQEYKKNVISYFQNNHSAQTYYEKLLQFVEN